MESISLLLNEALSPYPVTLTPSGSHGECLLTVNSRAGLVLLSREISHAQLNDKRLLTDVVDGLHRDLRIAEGRLEPSVIAALRHAAQDKVFRSAAV
ncbi:DUF3509 domain-containing protein [Pseudomonas sp. MWU13-2105]|uniref:DUF3509 domain-containing protein n=1 Tax=Pseudomonas sp. MWU13-2105 TaxID=2935074 RepID=UPI002010BB0D|nr:DUF3509 domain-containing protein [Pseudomonas sp. MWU13-2105]